MEISTLLKIINFDISIKATLCTQIEWKGSVPRKDYPMMLVDEFGNIIGTIGGGALEHSAIELTKSILVNNNSVIKTFDLTNQDVAQSGSICGGSTTILMEPFTNDIRTIFNSIIQDKVLNNNILVTTISTKEEVNITRKRITKDYHLAYSKNVVNIIDEAILQRASKSVKIDDVYYLIQYLGMTPTLHIFGAGHVGQAVSEMAHFIDIDTKIYDDRKDLATNERFPYATDLICSEINEVINNITINPNDFVLVATRGHKHDFEVMQWLLKLEIDYVSLVSSDKKWQLLSQALKKDGFSEETINRVHSPVGLDIGSETVPEIAISIISEIVNHYRKGKRSKISLSKL